MVRVVPSPTPATGPALPKVSFQRIEDEALMGPAGVPDIQFRAYGYNDGSVFKQPEHYIRYIEPLESELAVQVEYDMDEQDLEWVESVNAERKRDGIDKVSYEVFEVIMDRLEKEWFDLTKNIPKPDLAMPSEDSTCAVCDDSEGENTNAIVFCDGCNLAVHQDCYGVPYIPEGQWLCRKCTVSPENPVSCMLCPNEGGAFKQTVHGEWIHLLCAIWVPETRVANDVFMEPVTGVDKISKQRWKLKCSICDIREGACIQCIKSSCFTAFHATCARKEKLLMPMKSSQGSEAPTLSCYCEKHLPREQAEARQAALAKEQTETAASADTDANQKIARAYAKTYKLGPPLVPKIIVDRLMQYIHKVTLRQKREFVIMVCKYWSLKREARRGAPLLKRLHLEPWTASANGRHQSDEDKATKLQFLKNLREDLKRLRTLTDQTRRREALKLRQVQHFKHLVTQLLLPFAAPMRKVFESIRNQDHNAFFLDPVSKAEVPDYYDIITQPMCWSVIDRKLADHKYWYLQDFKDDIFLVVNNAMLYNKPDTLYYKTARRLKTFAEKVLLELDHLANLHIAPPSAEGTAHTVDDTGAAPETQSEQESQPPAKRSLLGDLEPTAMALDMLVNADHISSETPLLLEKSPIDSLFSYELPVLRRIPTPPPPPPPPPPPIPSLPAPPLPAPVSSTITILPAKPKRGRPPKNKGVLAATAPGDSTGQTLHAGAGSSKAPIPAYDATTQVATDGEPPRKKRRYQRRNQRPDLVGDVSDHQSFDMFHNGWILPDGQRRRRRAPRPSEPVEAQESRKGTIRFIHTNPVWPQSPLASSSARPADTWGAPLPEAAHTVEQIAPPEVPVSSAGPSDPNETPQLGAPLVASPDIVMSPPSQDSNAGNTQVANASNSAGYVEPPNVSTLYPNSGTPLEGIAHQGLVGPTMNPTFIHVMYGPPYQLSTPQPVPTFTPAQHQSTPLPMPHPVPPPPAQEYYPDPPQSQMTPPALPSNPRSPPNAEEEEESGPMAIPEEEEEEEEEGAGEEEGVGEEEEETEDEANEAQPAQREDPRIAQSILVAAIQKSLEPAEALLALAAEASLLSPARPSPIRAGASPPSIHASPPPPDLSPSPSPSPSPQAPAIKPLVIPIEPAPVEQTVERPSAESLLPPSPTSPDEVEEQIQVEEEITPLSSTENSPELPPPDEVSEPEVPAAEPPLEIEPGVETEVERETVPEPIPVAQVEPEAESDPNREADGEQEPKQEQETEMEQEDEKEQEKEPEQEPEPESEPESQSQVELEQETGPESEDEAIPSESKPPGAGPSEPAPLDSTSDVQSELTDIPSDDEESPLTDVTPQPDADTVQPNETSHRGGFLKKWKRGKVKKKSTKNVNWDLGKIVLKDGENLEGGTLVWARMKGYPWWPAVVFEPDDEQVPEWVLDMWRKEQKAKKLAHIIRFYDTNDSWQITELKNLLLLGEIEELDDDMRDAGSARQKWKSGSVRTECRKAYERAVAEMEAPRNA